MSANTKRVFYVKYLSSPIFAELLQARGRHPARPAGERQPRRCRGADPRGGACLPDRRGARRARPHLSRRRGPAAAHAEPADRLDQRRRLRHRRHRGLHRGRRAGRSTRPAATASRSPSTRSRMMLTLSKRIVETDRAHAARDRAQPQRLHRPRPAARPSASSASAMSASASRSCAAACSRMRVLAYDPYVSADVMTQHGVEKVDLDDADAPGRLRLDQLPADRRDAAA